MTSFPSPAGFVLQRRPLPELLSVVVPCHNEQDNIVHLHSRVSTLMAHRKQNYELIFVNDGSQDGTLAEIIRLRHTHPEVSVVNLTRNFGKEIALTAGLDQSAGDAVAVLDCDLQDPPELIDDFLAGYVEGYDIVCGRRVNRDSDTWFKRVTAHAFYRMMRNVGPAPLPENVGDFRLMSRRAVDSLLQLGEQHRFMKGLFAWIGYPTAFVDYTRPPRHAGRTKWNARQLLNLSIEGITSYTTLPLRLTTYLGFLMAFGAFLGGAIYLVRTLIYGDPVTGFPTLFLTILLIGGTQMLALGVIGEYLGRVFNETKRRPLYLIESVLRSDSGAARHTGAAPGMPEPRTPEPQTAEPRTPAYRTPEHR